MKDIIARIKSSKLALISIAAATLVIVIFLSLVIYTYSYGKIFPGVSAGEIILSGKDEAEAIEILDAACVARYEEAEIVVAVEDFDKIPVKVSELGIMFPSEEIANRAYMTGREGGLFRRMGDVLDGIFGGIDVGLSVNIDATARAILSEEFSKYDTAPVDATYTIEGNTLLLHPRHSGNSVNIDKLFEMILKAVEEEDYSEIAVEREYVESVALDLDKVYSEVHTEVKDAYVEKTADGSRIVPHVLGVDFDLEAAKKAYNETPDKIVKIPLKITQPRVYTKNFETNLFKYCLSDVKTTFNANNIARSANVRLAAKLINGTILNPGEEFSYNKTVGPRTTARGFRAAAIFAQGEVVDGIGGGICQVSSTLYMAAIRANMKITERKNHAFRVDYAPDGEDATVVYGSIDFRFKNTSAYPIKVVATSQGNYIRIQLMGTEPDRKVTVKLTKKTHSTTPYTTREKSSSSVAAGARKVDQKGKNGLSMSVYRNVYDENGKLIESYLENNSKYKPLVQIVLVGGGAPAPQTSAPTPTPTPATQTSAPTPAPQTSAPTPAPAPEAEAPAPAPTPEAEAPAPAPAPEAEAPAPAPAPEAEVPAPAPAPEAEAPAPAPTPEAEAPAPAPAPEAEAPAPAPVPEAEAPAPAPAPEAEAPAPAPAPEAEAPAPAPAPEAEAPAV